MADKPSPSTTTRRPCTTFDGYNLNSMASASSQFPSSVSSLPFASTSSKNYSSNYNHHHHYYHNSNDKTHPMSSAMATTTPTSQNKEPKKPFDISNLMSPPELPPYENFAQSTMAKSTSHVTSDVRKVPGPNAPISPPISPETRMHDSAFSPSVSPKTTATPCKDPILYPTHDLVHSPPQRPLFAPDDSVAAQRIVDEHVHARSHALFRQASPPQREDYELALFFKSQVMKKFMENPRGWLQRERAQLLEDRRAGARHNQFRLHPILAAKPQPIRQHIQRVVKPAASKPAKAPLHQQHHHQATTAAAAASAAAPPRPIRSNPPPIRAVPAPRAKSPTPEAASRRIVAPNREDKDFLSLPDICPPLSTLPPKSNSMKVDWKGAPIDLSADPHRDLLHPDELALAANLRLDCATYLTSKRRMFMKRLDCLRIGKEFRKTDAQQACKIDVNKASKLWTAFDKVGWLEKHHVASHV